MAMLVGTVQKNITVYTCYCTYQPKWLLCISKYARLSKILNYAHVVPGQMTNPDKLDTDIQGLYINYAL